MPHGLPQQLPWQLLPPADMQSASTAASVTLPAGLECLCVDIWQLTALWGI